MTAPDERQPVIRPRGRRPVPYVVTAAGRAALAAWPANRLEHEPRRQCSGRHCTCYSRWTRDGAR